MRGLLPLWTSSIRPASAVPARCWPPSSRSSPQACPPSNAAALGDRDLVEFSRQFTVELFAAATGELISTEPPTNGDNESGSEVSRS